MARQTCIPFLTHSVDLRRVKVYIFGKISSLVIQKVVK